MSVCLCISVPMCVSACVCGVGGGGVSVFLKDGALCQAGQLGLKS